MKSEANSDFGFDAFSLIGKSSGSTRRILKSIAGALHTFSMINEGDSIAAALSGGKDSWTLLCFLQYFRKAAPINFKMTALFLDAGFDRKGDSEKKRHTLCASLEKMGIRYRIIRRNIQDTIRKKQDPKKNICSFCSRLRRGAICRTAVESGCNKLALGHHADDMVETLLMNMFYNARTDCLKPVMHADETDITVIRPLVQCWEKDINDFFQLTGLPLFPRICPPGTSPSPQRRWIKKLLADISRHNPQIKPNLLSVCLDR